MNANHTNFAYISCDVPVEMTLGEYRRSIAPEPHGLRAAWRTVRTHLPR